MNEALEKDNTDLAKQVATLQLTVEKYEDVEQQLSDKEVTSVIAQVLRDDCRLKSGHYTFSELPA